VMSWVTRIVAVLSGFVVAYIVENSVSSQGRIRPILLIGALRRSDRSVHSDYSHCVLFGFGE